jgi:hypothetical protein
MDIGSIGIIVGIGFLYGVFLFWYGGRGKPLSHDERLLSMIDNTLYRITLSVLPCLILRENRMILGREVALRLLIMDDEIQHNLGNLFMLLG